MRRNYHRLAFVLALVLGTALIYGCGGSSDSSSSSATTAESSESTTESGDSGELGVEQHATVFDKEIEETEPSLEALDVKLGENTVKFAKGEPLKIAFSGFGKGFDYTVPEYEAAEQVAEELGLDVTSFDPRADPQLQIEQTQSAINSGQYNALVIYPLANELECDLLTKQAPSKGVVVLAFGYPACEQDEATPGLLTTIPDTPSRGTYTAWAERIVKDQGEPDKQKALVVTGPKTDWSAILAAEVLEEVMGGAGIEVQQVIDTDYSQAGSLPKVQDALQRYPDTTMIVNQFPEGTSATLTALKIAGKSGDINVYGWGANESAVKGIEDGTLKMAVPYYPYTNVKAALQALQLMRDGKKVPPYVPYAGHTPESMRGAGDEALFVEPDNVKEYAEKVQEY
jgi:ABC-type sugar transport system substrate-binding protein